MTEETPNAARGARPSCPRPTLTTCPSCGAHLTSAAGAEPDIKGVTSLDPLAIIQARADVARPRNRIMSFITGEAPGESEPTANPESLAPPDDAVRREMLRLELEAERADLEAESVALKTDVIVEQNISLAAPCVRRHARGGRGGPRRGRPWMPPWPRPRPPRACPSRTAPPARAVGACRAVPPPPSPPADRRREPDRRLTPPPGILGACLTACPIRVRRICASRSSGSATASWRREWPSPSTVPTTGGWPCSGWPTPTAS